MGVDAKRLFCCFTSILWGRMQGAKDRWRGKRRRGIQSEMGVGASIRWDKSRFDLQHCFHPRRVASCAPPSLLLSLLPPPLPAANQWAWIPAATVWGGNNDVLEHKGISRSDERLIWCERESRAASQTGSPSLSVSLTLFSPSLLPLSAQSPHSLTRSDSASSSWGSRHSSLLPPPHPQGLGCDPSCQYCSVFDLRGRRMCVGGRGCVHHLVERSSLLRWCKPQTVEKLSHLLKTLIGTEVSFD